MTLDEIRAAFVAELTAVAPDIDVQSLRDNDHLQDDLGLDSMAFLNLVSALHNRPTSAHEIQDAKLVTAIKTSFKASDRTYGARRVWRDVLENGLAYGFHRIERLIRINALRARPRRLGRPKDDGERSVIADVEPVNATGSREPARLDRDFQAERPNQKWLADFTYIWTAEGWLYVAVVLDLFSRRVVGWPMKADRDASLVMDALMMAVWRRGKADALLHHSDQGSQYTSEQFQRLLAENGITCSMSRAGNVWDNSAMESVRRGARTGGARAAHSHR